MWSKNIGTNLKQFEAIWTLELESPPLGPYLPNVLQNMSSLLKFILWFGALH